MQQTTPLVIKQTLVAVTPLSVVDTPVQPTIPIAEDKPTALLTILLIVLKIVKYLLALQ